jgi:hypothetical protein
LLQSALTASEQPESINDEVTLVFKVPFWLPCKKDEICAETCSIDRGSSFARTSRAKIRRGRRNAWKYIVVNSSFVYQDSDRVAFENDRWV